MSQFKKHFRIYFKSGHPAYIIDEEGKYYYFHRVTSAPKSGHHSNWKIDPNPDPTRETAMYIVHNEQKDLKTNFSDELPFNIELVFIKRKRKKKSN